MHYYSPASELSHRSRKKKKPKTQSKSSQSLFSVIVTVNHGLVALQAHATVNTQPFSFPPTFTSANARKHHADCVVVSSRKRIRRR